MKGQEPAKGVKWVTLSEEERAMVSAPSSTSREKASAGSVVWTHTCTVTLPDAKPCCVHYSRYHAGSHVFHFQEPLHQRLYIEGRMEGGVTAIEGEAQALIPQAIQQAQGEEQQRMRQKTSASSRALKKTEDAPPMTPPFAERYAGRYAVCVKCKSGRLLRIGPIHTTPDAAAEEIKSGKYQSVHLVNGQTVVIGVCSRVERRWIEPQFLSERVSIQSPPQPDAPPAKKKPRTGAKPSPRKKEGGPAMKYYGKAQEAAERLLQAFETGDLPQALAQVFIRRKDDVPCRRWSWNNQVITALMGHHDARGFRQWQEVGRTVKKGEHAFCILAPLVKIEKQADEETGEASEARPEEGRTERRVLYGFKGLPVFGLEQTEGDPLPPGDPQVEGWIASLPLLEVAKAWGLTVEAYDGKPGVPLGRYARRQGIEPSLACGTRRIAVGVQNLSSWAHEMIHAADDKNGTLTERGQHWRSEAVAELGGAVLLECLGYHEESDRGGCWQYIREYATREKLDPLWVCAQVTDRVCKAVARLLEEAEAWNQGEASASYAPATQEMMAAFVTQEQ